MSLAKLKQDEVNKTAWNACDTFRGKIDSSIYKDYILVMLFIKYVSDIHKEHYEELMIKYKGNHQMVERQLMNDRFILNEKSTFDYLYENRLTSVEEVIDDEGNKKVISVGERINIALEKIEEDNKSKLNGVFRNIDFNSEVILGKTKDRNAMLKHLLEDFKDLDLRPSRLENDDVIGNTYEYLIARFASDAGKKGGEFFTPKEVSELISRLVKPQENDRIYDPTCGSGSLLLKAYNKIPSGKAQIYGQERNGQTHSLCRMNMFLHGVDDAKIEWGDTLSNPLHLDDEGNLMKFQVVVANPPFSLDKWAMGFAKNEDKSFKMESHHDQHNRFLWGVPPKSKGDFAFVQHMLYSLAEDGRMGLVLPHGVLFRGGQEEKIRKEILDLDLLDAIIGLPENLFFGTGIPAVVLVFKQGRKKSDVLFIDASGEGNYEKGKNQNNLREEDINRIVQQYEKYESEDKYAYVATKDEIVDNDYNLNIPRYVDTFEEEELIDLNVVATAISKIKDELTDVEAKMDDYLKNLGF